MTMALLLNCVRRSGDSMTGDLAMAAGKKVDGRDVSEDLVKIEGGEMTGNLTFATGKYVEGGKIRCGTYVGDGTDNRNIDIGFNLGSKSNVYILIKQASTLAACHRIEYARGDLSMFFFCLWGLGGCILGRSGAG